jgi:hypothetical protein
MPAQFTLKQADFSAVLRELKDLDKTLVNELRKEFRTQLKPVNDSVKSKIPTEAPLSGFSRRDGSEPYIWSRPTAKVVTSFRPPRGKAFTNLVSTQFSQRRPNAGFNVMELAGSKSSGNTPQGRMMIEKLNSRFPISGGLGRFAIPEWKKKGPEVEKIVRRILDDFSGRVSRKFKDGS